MRHAPRIVLLVCLLSLFNTLARAQWISDGAPVCTAGSDQEWHSICPDGAGGAIIAWRDYRGNGGTEWDIYAQRVNAYGVPQWTADGVVICSAIGHQWTTAITSDGAGGAIITWQDNRGAANDIYVQRVNASGVPQWTANGVALCTAANDQVYPRLVTDGAGGAIVTWHDYRSGSNYDVYAQRVNSTGAVQWAANGKSVCTAAFDQSYPQPVADNAGGVIIAWADARGGPNRDIYAQRLNSSGTPQWVANGVALCSAVNDQGDPVISSDGAGGALVVWKDYRSSLDTDIYAQKVNISGVPQWTADGVGISASAANEDVPTIMSDGAGGAFVAWVDNRNISPDIYARRVNAAGFAMWTYDGIQICGASNVQWSPALLPDGAGGAIVAWQDSRGGIYSDIYAQRVTAQGTTLWASDGNAVCTAYSMQYLPALVSDGANGAVVAWTDVRSSTSNDIYAQRIEFRYGNWGKPEPTITSVADIRNDQGGKVKVNWTASGRDVLGQATITHYSIWRATDVAAAVSAQEQHTLLETPSRISGDLKSKAVWVQHAPATDYYWEWVGSQDALNQKGYSFSASTRADSTLQGVANHQFMVSSHTYDDFTYWLSNVVSAHSVDNLAPAAPLFLTAQRAGASVNLKWNRVRVADLRDYSVYRKTSAGVTPVPVNFLSSANDTVLVDSSAPAGTLYYIVTAYDVHANQSAPSNEASVAPSTGVGDTPPIRALTLLPNHPNPFSTSATLEIGLPKASSVEITVYDIAGRQVSTRSLGARGAGWQKIILEAKDDAGAPLPSGVYFYRVTAGGETQTRKMVIAR